MLRLCEWHRVEAIKRHLVAAGRYPKEVREKIIDLIWKWVKSSNLIDLEANRAELLQALLPAEQEFLLLNYQPKEHQFMCAYTRLYPNLGAHSTQQSELYCWCQP